MSLKRSANAAGLPDHVDDAPCCWLCLEEGEEESGKPLIRNCSCRGTSGFVHLSCAVKYAEKKSREVYEIEEYYLVDFFTVCPNCKQDYQGEVRYALAKAQVEFVEKEFKYKHVLYLEAMVYRMIVLNENNYAHDRLEGEVISCKMLSIIEEFDKDPLLQHVQLVTRVMALVHHSIGEFRNKFGTDANLEKAKKHYELAKNLYEVAGREVEVMTMEREIRMVVAKLNGNENELETTEEKIIYCQKRYNHSLDQYGENNLDTIDEGIGLAMALHKAGHTIESERFLTKLEQISRRVHGHSHNITKHILAEWQEIKLRQVYYLSAEQGLFQALRYDNDGEKIILRGPLPKLLNERNVDEEKTFNVESKDIIPKIGTPVVCHGLRLRSMSRLNGKIGDIRVFSEDKSICEVHFEEEGLEPTKVRRENVRILFDLPEKK
jgi:hypothetical protein